MYSYLRQLSQKNLFQSATNFEEIDVSVSDYVPDKPFKGIYVGVGGDVVITDLNGSDATFKDLAPSTVHPIAGIKVKNSGTAATSIVILR